MTAIAFSETQAREAPARRVDPRLAFLLSCAIRFELVEQQEMTLDEAFDDIARLWAIVGIACRCECEILNAFERYAKPTQSRRSS
jgi:hypothetical protein